jgi:hypothetical protein
MSILKVLTYNVCFGCMLGSEDDVSALPLARRCASTGDSPNRCLLQVVSNIDRAGDLCGGLDLVGLQEASAWSEIKTRSRELVEKTPVVTRVGKEELVLFVGSPYRVLWKGDGEVSGRPLQVVRMTDERDGRALVVVHLHNNHRERGATELLQRSIANVAGVDAAVESSAGGDFTVICMGDWNDTLDARRGFRPFLMCGCNQRIKDIAVSATSSIPRSCCSTEVDGKRMKFVSDYVMSNRRCRNQVPSQLLMDMMRHDASDHYAVLAVIGQTNSFHPLFHLLCDA